MNLLNIKNKSLRYKTITYLKTNNKDLFEPIHKSAVKIFINFVSERNQYWLIFLFVVIVLLVSLINIDFLNFIVLDYKSATIIVDQRTTNIATIISITLVVVGFILNNLAVKVPIVLELLFRKSLLYPIIYLTLSVIGTFIATSTLRDTLSPFAFKRFILAGTYLSILILILIAMLFRKILMFSDEKEIDNMLDEELMIEAKFKIKQHQIQKQSQLILEAFLENEGAKANDIGNIYNDFFLEFNMPIKNRQSEKLLYDINLDLLLTSIKKHKNECVFYNSLCINKNITDENKFLWINSSHNNAEKEFILHNSFILKKVPKKFNEKMQKFYSMKFDRITEQENHSSMRRILSSFVKLYTLQMQNQQGLSVGNTDITGGYKSKLSWAFNKSISKKNVETIEIFNTFVLQVLQLAITNNSIYHFRQYIDFPSEYYNDSYQLAKRNESHIEIYKECSKMARKTLIDIITYLNIFFSERKNNDDLLIADKFYYEASNGISKLLYCIVNNGDINQFSIVINELYNIIGHFTYTSQQIKNDIDGLIIQNSDAQNNNTIKTKLKEIEFSFKIKDYIEHTILEIKYWVLFLYRVEKIDENTVLQFMSKIIHNSAVSYELLDKILSHYDSYDSDNYMRWGNWNYIEVLPGQAYEQPHPSKWLISGFFADQIINNRLLFNEDYSNSKAKSRVIELYDRMKSEAIYYENNFEKWKNILSVDNIARYRSITADLLEKPAILKRKFFNESNKSIVQAPLDRQNVDSFKSMVKKVWNSNAIIHIFFKHFGNIQNIYDQEIILRNFGYVIFYKKSKELFLESHEPPKIDSIVEKICLKEENFFLKLITDADHHSVRDESMQDALIKSITELKNLGTVPNFVLLSSESFYKDNGLLNSCLFTSKQSNTLPKNDLDSFYIGTFENIPVYTSSSNSLNNIILVCNFNEAFQQLYKSTENPSESELNIDVQLVTDELANAKLEKERSEWTKSGDGITLTDEEALLFIKTSINIDIQRTVDYKIINKNAYIIGRYS